MICEQEIIVPRRRHIRRLALSGAIAPTPLPNIVHSPFKPRRAFPRWIGLALLWLGFVARGFAAQDTDRDGIPDITEQGIGRYMVILGDFTWTQARLDAVSRGGHLATVVSEREWLDMRMVLGPAMIGRNLWLGAKDAAAEGTWRWITGEKWGYTHWREGEPNNDSLGNGSGTKESYLMLWGKEVANLDGDAAYWNDLPITGGLLARDGYVLEFGYWTDYTKADTDGDGLTDAEEAKPTSTYSLVTTQAFTWQGAREDATKQGGRLAEISSELIWRRIQLACGTNLLRDSYWVGGSDAVQEAKWRWNSGELFSYTNWALGQPDNLTEQDYLMIRPPQGLWSDMSSNVLAFYVLERLNLTPTDPNNPDSDGDGLSDGDEVHLYGTDPLNKDTDADFISDYEEIFVHRSNPLSTDTDGDGVSDFLEFYQYHSNLLKPDSDGDGIPDSVEAKYGSSLTDAGSVPTAKLTAYRATELEFATVAGQVYQIQMRQPDGTWQNQGDPIQGTGSKIDRFFSLKVNPQGLLRVAFDPALIAGKASPSRIDYGTNSAPPIKITPLDADGDGISNVDEVLVYNTNPQKVDSDSDGLSDYEEIKLYKTNPLKVDSDGDGLNDIGELRKWYTNPLDRDTDGDGLLDGNEVFSYRTNPRRWDTDQDRFSDGDEVQRQTNPKDPLSLLGPVTRYFTPIELEFQTENGAIYQIQTQSESGKWVNSGPPITVFGPLVTRIISTREKTSSYVRVLLLK